MSLGPVSSGLRVLEFRECRLRESVERLGFFSKAEASLELSLSHSQVLKPLKPKPLTLNPKP